MDTMIERAARALCANNSDNEDNWKVWVEDVRLVLKAIREPNVGMIDAAISARSIGDGGVSDAYRSMIDAVLEDA